MPTSPGNDGRLGPGDYCEGGGIGEPALAACGTSNALDNCRIPTHPDYVYCDSTTGGCSDVYRVADCTCGNTIPPSLPPPVSPPPPKTPPSLPEPSPPPPPKAPKECGDTGELRGSGCLGMKLAGMCTCESFTVVGRNCQGTCGCCPSPPPPPGAPPLPPQPPVSPSPLRPGEQSGVKTIRVEERFATSVTTVFDAKAISQRAMDYAEAIRLTFEERIATTAKVTVTVGEIVVVALAPAAPPGLPPSLGASATSATSVLSSALRYAAPGARARSLRSLRKLSYSECALQYTPVTAEVVLELAVPLEDAERMIEAIPESTFNEDGEVLPVCTQELQQSPLETVFAGPPPPSPPPTPLRPPPPGGVEAEEETPSLPWWWIVVGLAAAAFCCGGFFFWTRSRRRSEKEEISGGTASSTAAGALAKLGKLGVRRERAVLYTGVESIK